MNEALEIIEGLIKGLKLTINDTQRKFIYEEVIKVFHDLDEYDYILYLCSLDPVFAETALAENVVEQIYLDEYIEFRKRNNINE